MCGMCANRIACGSCAARPFRTKPAARTATAISDTTTRRESLDMVAPREIAGILALNPEVLHLLLAVPEGNPDGRGAEQRPKELRIEPLAVLHVSQRGNEVLARREIAHHVGAVRVRTR